MNIKALRFFHLEKNSALAVNAPSNVSWTEIEQFLISGWMKSREATCIEVKSKNKLKSLR